MPVTPHVLVVRSASATSLAAPRAQFVDSFRGRVTTITGADEPVDTVPISTFNL